MWSSDQFIFQAFEKKPKSGRFFLLYKNCDNKPDYEFAKEMAD